MDNDTFQVIILSIIVGMLTFSILMNLDNHEVLNSNLQRMSNNTGIINDNIGLVYSDLAQVRGSIHDADQLNTIPLDQSGLYTCSTDTITIYVKGRDYNSVEETLNHEWIHRV